MTTVMIASLITMYANVYNVDRADLSCSIKLATNYKTNNIVYGYNYGIGLIDEPTVRAWKLDRSKLVRNTKYSIEMSAKYLDFIKQSYKESDFTTWQCGFRSKYTTRSGFCVEYMIKFRKCVANKEYL